MAEIYYYNTERSIVLSVDSHGMEAHLLLEERIPFYNESDIINLFKQAGIISGFQAAKEYLEPKDIPKLRGKPFLAAKGIPVSLPERDYSFLCGENFISPEEIFDQGFYWSFLLKKTAVNKRQKLATFEIKSKGKEGMDIFGKPLSFPQEKAKLGHYFAGENVIYDEENDLLIAAADGYPYLDNSNRLAVCHTISVKGDLQLEDVVRDSPNPEVPVSQPSDRGEMDKRIEGNLLVKGSIKGPGKLSIKGNLTVEGDISGCSLYVEGQTRCPGRVSNTILLSLNSVELGIAINSRINSGNDLLINSYAEDSLLLAETDVKVSNDTSYCQNCTVYAGKMILLNESLNRSSLSILPSSDISNRLTISIAPFTKELISYLSEQQELRRTNAPGDDHETEERNSVLESLKEHLLKRFSLINYEDCSIEISKKVSVATYIRVLKCHRILEKDLEGVNFFLKNDKLVTKRKIYMQ
jgi:hypothetical protein